jgi:hypothetical protein
LAGDWRKPVELCENERAELVNFEELDKSGRGIFRSTTCKALIRFSALLPVKPI